MRHCVIAGRPQAGKTLLLIQFAGYLGMSAVQLLRRTGEGETSRSRWMLSQAKRDLVGSAPHTTRGAQQVDLEVPAGKQRRVLRVVDTQGLVDEIPADTELRRGMAATLDELFRCSLVLHVVDAAEVGRPPREREEPAAPAVHPLDLELAEFVSAGRTYALIANKVDLPWALTGVDTLRRTFPNRKVIPVSALERSGFRELKAFLWRHA